MKLEGLQMPKQVDIEKESQTETFGRFVIQPLERGFGVTLGHSLRRTLLSSIKGAAIKQFKIDGIQHEFTTIDGVREDVPEIVLNLKQVALRYTGNEDRTLRIEKSGVGNLVAGDLSVDPSVQVMNPKLHLATLGEDANLVLELTVGVGRGYCFAEDNKNSDQPIGSVPIDSSFSPVTKVKYEIENARVGRRTDYDSLKMDIWTDGSKSPEDALGDAARILTEHFGLFLDVEEEVEIPEEIEVDEETKRVARLLAMPVDELELSVRSANCLRAAGISYLRELVGRSEAEMLKYRNFGRKSLNELGEIIDQLDLKWGMDLEPYEDVEIDDDSDNSYSEEF
ncbi:MAG: DNA-directed RNA polymerase subunit alpha [Candidatus Latescibacterota bacterium]|nr:DNA-directed RNA polymerase subunit alpha [Candidatus Latescibacterota bacterium]